MVTTTFIPVTGTFNGNTTITNTTMSSSPLPLPKIQLSSQPVYQAQLRIVGQNPINDTHASVTLSGNSTLTLSNATQTINTPITVVLLSQLQQNLLK